MERDQPQRVGRRVAEGGDDALDLGRPQRAALLLPRPNGVQADREDAIGAVELTSTSAKILT
jgi:hypothetical protein